MKRLCLLLATACISLASCSETADDPNDPNGIKNRFDFSNVDTKNLSEIHEEVVNIDGLTVISGVLNDCLWVGVFDTESGALKFQYTDVDHPTSYFAYGEEYKYGIGEIAGMYLENNHIVFVIRYADPQYENIGWLDLIVNNGDKQYRYVIDEKSICLSASITKWANSSIYITLGEKGFIYDLYNNEILCCAIGTSGRIENDIYHNLIISPTNALHFWKVELFGRFGPDYGSRSNSNDDWWPEGHAEDLEINEWQCTYDTTSCTTEYTWIYDHIDDNSSKTPRYSFEYKIRTNDHILLLTTQIEYDGTVTTKTVDIRVENDELKIEVQ